MVKHTCRQFVTNLLTNCLSVFDHFVGLALKGLRIFANYAEKHKTNELWLNLQRINTEQKKMSKRKKDEKSLHQNSIKVPTFLLEAKE